MTPNANGKAAYARGYHDGGAGKTETDNPYQYRSRRLGGIALSAWWSSGFTDYRIGRPPRWQAWPPAGPNLSRL